MININFLISDLWIDLKYKSSKTQFKIRVDKKEELYNRLIELFNNRNNSKYLLCNLKNKYPLIKFLSKYFLKINSVNFIVKYQFV
jgi:hypothetical protein